MISYHCYKDVNFSCPLALETSAIMARTEICILDMIYHILDNLCKKLAGLSLLLKSDSTIIKLLACDAQMGDLFTAL